MPKKRKELLGLLNEIVESEISGVVRYLHYSLMVKGPNRIPIVAFFRAQAQEALLHAQTIGEKVTSLGGHPSLKVAPVPETHRHKTLDILKESLEFESNALRLYKKALKQCTEDDVALEELLRQFVRTETEHVDEVSKMIQDY